MEAVAAHPFVVEAVGYGIAIGRRGMAAMERGVEAGDLRQLRKALADRADRRKVVRLVQRRERHEALELRDHLVVDQNRLRVDRPAMDDAMPDGGKVDAVLLPQHGAGDLDRGGEIAHLAGLIGLIGENRVVGAGRLQPRAGSDAVDLTANDRRRAAARRREHLELEAR